MESRRKSAGYGSSSRSLTWLFLVGLSAACSTSDGASQASDAGAGGNAGRDASAAGANGTGGAGAAAGGAGARDGAAAGTGAHADGATDGAVANADTGAGDADAAADASNADVALGDGPARDGNAAPDAGDGSTVTNPCGTDGSTAGEADSAAAGTDRCDPACDPLPPDGGTNLVANSGFESGVDGWSAPYGGTVTVSSTHFHCGTHSVASVDRAEFYHMLAYAVDLPPDTTYRYSFWIKHTGTASRPFGIQAYAKTASAPFGALVFTQVPPNAWTRMMGTFPTPTGARTDQLYIVQQQPPSPSYPDAGAYPDFYVDDLYVVP